MGLREGEKSGELGGERKLSCGPMAESRSQGRAMWQGVEGRLAEEISMVRDQVTLHSHSKYLWNRFAGRLKTETGGDEERK